MLNLETHFYITLIIGLVVGLLLRIFFEAEVDIIIDWLFYGIQR